MIAYPPEKDHVTDPDLDPSHLCLGNRQAFDALKGQWMVHAALKSPCDV